MALIPYAQETIASLAAATPLTAGTYNVSKSAPGSMTGYYRPEMATISVETAAIRATVNGTTPTTTATTGVGHLFDVGDVLTLKGYQEISQWQAINAVAGSGAALRVTYYRL